MSDDYEIGYGKPPKHTRFPKGQSGNPRGRTKGTKDLKTDLQEEMQEQVSVREGERTRKYSKQRLVVKSVTAKAIKGDPRATAILLNLMLRILVPVDATGAEAPITDDEREILLALEERIARRLNAKDGGTIKEDGK